MSDSFFKTWGSQRLSETAGSSASFGRIRTGKGTRTIAGGAAAAWERPPSKMRSGSRKCVFFETRVDTIF